MNVYYHLIKAMSIDDMNLDLSQWSKDGWRLYGNGILPILEHGRTVFYATIVRTEQQEPMRALIHLVEQTKTALFESDLKDEDRLAILRDFDVCWFCGSDTRERECMCMRDD